VSEIWLVETFVRGEWVALTQSCCTNEFDAQRKRDTLCAVEPHGRFRVVRYSAEDTRG